MNFCVVLGDGQLVAIDEIVCVVLDMGWLYGWSLYLNVPVLDGYFGTCLVIDIHSSQIGNIQFALPDFIKVEIKFIEPLFD